MDVFPYPQMWVNNHVSCHSYRLDLTAKTAAEVAAIYIGLLVLGNILRHR